jgi:hypothetical protein
VIDVPNDKMDWIQKRILVVYLDTLEQGTFPFSLLTIEKDYSEKAIGYLKSSIPPIPTYFEDEYIGNLVYEPTKERKPHIQLRTVKRYKNDLINSWGKVRIDGNNEDMIAKIYKKENEPFTKKKTKVKAQEE